MLSNLSNDSHDHRRTIALFLKLALGAFLVIGTLSYAFYSHGRDSAFRQLKATEKQRVAHQAIMIREEMRYFAADLILTADQTRHALIEERSRISELAQEFLMLLQSVEKYNQISLVSSEGQELIRVERGPDGPVIPSTADLENINQRPYFLETIQMEPGEIYLSHLDLKRKKGEIQSPFLSVLRLATPVYLDSAKTEKAAIVINSCARDILKMNQLVGTRFSGRMLLVNSDGYWIQGLEDTDEWGFLLEDRKEKTFENTFPGDWLQMSVATKGQFESEHGIFTFETIVPSSIVISVRRDERLEHTERYTANDIGSTFQWKIISYVAPNVKVAAATKRVLTFAVGILMFLWVVCWYVANVLTTRKKALNKVEKSESLNRSIVNTATDGIIIINGAGEIQAFNEAAATIFGYEAQEVIGHNVTLLMPEKYVARHSKRLRRASRAESCSASCVLGVTQEIQGRRVDGSLFDLELSVNSFEVAGERMFTGMVRDITERKKAAVEMELLALFAEFNPSPLVRISNDSRILHRNTAASTLLGISDNYPAKLHDIIPEFDPSAIATCVKSGDSISRYFEVNGRSFLGLLRGLSEQRVCHLYAMDITERKEAELTAVEFGRLLDDSVNEVYITDVKEQKFVMVNKAACANLGYTFEELLELSPLGIKRPEYSEKLLKLIVEPLLNGKQNLVYFTADHVRKDGSIYPAEITVQLSTFKSQPVFVAFVVDVTEKVEAERQQVEIEKRFREEESRKRDLVDSLIKDVSRKTGSAFFHELTRRLAEELDMDCALVGEFVGEGKKTVRAQSLYTAGKTLSFYEYEIAKTPCEKAMATGFASYVEGVQKTFPDACEAKKFNINGYIGASLTSSDGEALGILVVTSSKPIVEIEFKETIVHMFAARAASELERIRNERQTKQLAQAVVATSDIVIITDTRGMITYVNPAFEKITGYTVAEVIGENPRILSSGQQGKAFYQQMWESLLANGEWRGVLVNKKKSGERYTAEVSISSIKDENGNVTNFIGVQRDVTEQRETERHMRQAQKMESIGALAGGIAHDFNNMLMGITGFTQLVCDELPADSPLAEDLHDALAASERAKDLVQQILTFSRQRESERKLVMLHIVIKEALKLLKATLPANIEVAQDIPNDCGFIMGDPTQIHQIMLNLCTNAYHAMQGKGGKLSIVLEVVDIGNDPDARLAQLKKGSYLALSVIDTGCGMDAETKLRIFEPFFTTKEEGKGTGMGLATVYGIVHEYGGVITVDSEVGEGSTFTVYFPRCEGDKESDRARSEANYKGQERVLIVEDDEQALKVIQKMLRKLGYLVTGREDPVAALETLKLSPGDFDLILTDKTMPKMSGMEFAEKARQIGTEIPILLMTGYAESITPEVAKGLGFSSLIIKPFDAKKIGWEIQKALKKQAPETV